MFPSLASIIPTKSAKRIIGSISPFAIAPIGFLGMMLSKVSTISVSSAVVVISAFSTESISRPMPGSIILATVRAITTARAVVAM